MTDRESPTSTDKLESALRDAAGSITTHQDFDSEEIRRRANRHTSISDAVNYGFARLLGSLLVMLAGLGNSLRKPPKPTKTQQSSGEE
ncbi:MAG: hypothetical protein ACI82A_001443 [Candidatus Azotimanducaceae bacterium]|jgi:hypothetical protein